MDASYLDLVMRFALRPLRSGADLDAAVSLIDELIDRCALTGGQADYLDVLGTLVERYERSTEPPAATGTDAEVLSALIMNKGVSQVETARGCDMAESTVSAVLSGKRKLNRKQIRSVTRFFNVSNTVFFD